MAIIIRLIIGAPSIAMIMMLLDISYGLLAMELLRNFVQVSNNNNNCDNNIIESVMIKSDERIIMNNLIPGKRYCFNGWAYNSCGRGPVFTLEGVCAINNQDCHVKSDEHCELDVDYSW